MIDVTPSQPRVFFSWQSDSPTATNSNAIRSALGAAARRIQAKRPKLKIVNDEATRDTSGSPNIVMKILEKIDASDVYVADITTITRPSASRHCPNPNVAFELGYAVAQLGWDRIILLFNTAHGDFPEDMPFDVNQQRASPYELSLAAAGEGRSSALENLLTVAIRAVLEKNPKTPIELRGLSKEKIEHERDAENIEWLLSQIHVPTLDAHISQLPRVIVDRGFWFWEGFNGVVTNSLFHLYDTVLEEYVANLRDAWSQTLSFDNRYHDAPGGRQHIFSNPGDGPLRPDQQMDWDAIEQASQDMNVALQAMLARVRAFYVEVDIKKTNAKAWQEFLSDQQAAREAFPD